MASADLVIQKPPAKAAQLILLFPGSGTDLQALLALGRQLGQTFPGAMVVAVQAPAAPTEGTASYAHQWFEVAALGEDSLQEQIDAAMPAFIARIAHWQAQAEVDAHATALIGFSQGAALALEATKLPKPPASRTFAVGGRFASLPESGSYSGTVHFLHGKEDRVVAYQNTIVAAHYLRDQGVDITAEVLPFVGHDLHPEFAERIVNRLSTHISHRVWNDVIQSADVRQ